MAQTSSFDSRPLSSTSSPSNASSAQADSPFTEETPQFLPVDQAFQLAAWQQDRETIINWQITPGYYLYQHRLGFEDLGQSAELEPALPSGKDKTDDYFGDVTVYYDELEVKLDSLPLQLKVSYQGCADAGLCYPPQNRYLTLTAGGEYQITSQAPADLSSSTDSSTSFNTEESSYTALLASASLPAMIGLFLLAGLALTFTPCVLPMVPIISGIVLGQDPKPGRGRAFSLSLVYVLAMAGTYALAGTLTGYFGAELNLQMQLQSPIILSLFALLFVALALSMFGLYELQLPQVIQSRLLQASNNTHGGQFAGVAVMGILSSLIVSPCVSAPLAGALVYISSSGNPLLGGTALFALGLGMGLPLLLIGTFGSQLMPRSGAWMIQVKILFGVIMLGLAVWMIERIIPARLTLVLGVTLLVGYGCYLAGYSWQQRLSRPWLASLVAIVVLTYALLLATGGLAGGTHLFNLRANFESNDAHSQLIARFIPISTLDELNSLTEQSEQPVMVDFYADWCISCQVLENEVFVDAAVLKQLEGFTLARIDITKNSSTDQQLLNHFELFGPPALLFFNREEIVNARILGEPEAADFAEHLAKISELIGRKQ